MTAESTTETAKTGQRELSPSGGSQATGQSDEGLASQNILHAGCEVRTMRYLQHWPHSESRSRIVASTNSTNCLRVVL